MNIQFNINHLQARNFLFLLILTEFLFFSVYLLGTTNTPLTITSTFDLDGEATIPAWFSSIQLFLTGLVLLSFGNWEKNKQIRNPFFIYLTGIVFIFLSLDESAMMHEKITRVLRTIEGVPSFKGGHGIWIYLYALPMLVGVFLGFSTVKTFFRTYFKQALFMTAGVLIFIFGAVGIEIVSYQFLRDDLTSTFYKLSVAFEEVLEMMGISLFLYGSLLCAIQTPHWGRTSNE